jgi:hypothetical protein
MAGFIASYCRLKNLSVGKPDFLSDDGKTAVGLLIMRALPRKEQCLPADSTLCTSAARSGIDKAGGPSVITRLLSVRRACHVAVAHASTGRCASQ